MTISWRDHDGICEIRDLNGARTCTCGLQTPQADTSPREVAFTKLDLQFMREQASKFWQETDNKKQLPGDNKAITEEDIRALSWLVAAADLMYRKGYNTFVTPRLDVPSSEQAASDH